jgi:hypothetical protein
MGNRFNYFLGAAHETWLRTLIDCAFDCDDINKTNHVRVETTRCTYKPDAAVEVVTTKSRSAEMTRRPSPGDAHAKLSRGAIFGIVVSAVLLLGGGGAVAVCFELGQRKDGNMEEALISANSYTDEMLSIKAGSRPRLGSSGFGRAACP